MRRGRPLYFLVTVGLGWAGFRAAMLWPAVAALPAPQAAEAPSPAAPRSVATLAVVDGRDFGGDADPSRAWRAPAAAGRDHPAASPALDRAEFIGDVAPLSPVSLSSFTLQPGRGAEPRERGTATVVPITVAPTGLQVVLAPRLPMAEPARPQRWSLTGWLIARSGAGLGASPDAPQLGGTQGGVRVDYEFSNGLAATGRVAAPAAGAGREASLGLAWRPAALPLRFVAEQRFALDGGRGGPSVGVSGGVSNVPIAAGFAFESYAQAGLIWRDGTEHYADAIARATRIVADAAKLRLDLGMGAWGGVQRGVQRLDIGPSLGARLPVASGAMRLSLDWRQRIAGNARPGSGPAISAGADF